MYYDLITSLPLLHHFEQVGRAPITPLRLNQRLQLLAPAHAGQLTRVRPLVAWRRDHLLSIDDAALVAEYSAATAALLEPPLRDYLAFRMDQQTLLAALRRKREGEGPPDGRVVWGAGSWVYFVRTHWDEPAFRLAHLYPWLPQASDLLVAGDARGLERLLMDVAWRWLGRCAEQSMFGFQAVFSYVFKWDILQAWLVCDARQGKARFRELIDKVTHVECN